MPVPIRTPEHDEPDQSSIVLRKGREVVRYEVERQGGQIRSISQVTAYTSPAVSSEPYISANRSEQILGMWRKLQNVPPEAVLKRGSQEVSGTRLLRFEIINAKSIPGLEGNQSGTSILVDPKTKCPVVLEAGSTHWTDIRFNPAISAERFTPPVVPEDLDAEVMWGFTLPGERPRGEKFSFRVVDPDGKPIVTEKALRALSDQGLFGNSSASLDAGEFGLTPEGVDKLDRFMARNPGATMTIEIAGEPAIKRVVYGRLSRTMTPVNVRFLSSEQIKAATQPATNPAGE
jgi:hypothetical protein